MKIILIVAVALVLAPYVLGPIMVYLTQRLPARYRFTKLDEGGFLAERSATFCELHEKLIGEGFHYLGSSTMDMSKVTMYFSLYLDGEHDILCTLSIADSALGASTQMEFTRMFTDGSLINVNNNALFGAYPRNPSKEEFRFPDINDFDVLLEAAKRLFAARRHARTPRQVAVEDGWSTVEDVLNAEQEALCRKGWIAESTDGRERRLTAKGALLMTWKHVWPIKQLLNARDIRAARNALNAAA